MASSTAMKAAKKELRSAMKQKLAALSKDSVSTQSNTIFQKITDFKLYQEAKRIGIYLSMPGGELQTDAIVRRALESGKQVFVPYLHKELDPAPGTPQSVMDMVDLRSLSDYNSLKRDSWGIPTIDAESVGEREHILGNSTGEIGKLDLILMPGVAFDLDVNTGFVRRLGHGKGFYDYFLYRYMRGRGSQARELSLGPGTGTDIFLYGLALEEQFLPVEAGLAVPMGEYDYLLHGLLVGNGKLLEATVKKPQA